MNLVTGTGHAIKDTPWNHVVLMGMLSQGNFLISPLDGFYKSYALHTAVILGIGVTVCTLYIHWISDTVFHQHGLDLWEWILVDVYGLFQKFTR